MLIALSHTPRSWSEANITTRIDVTILTSSMNLSARGVYGKLEIQ